MAKADQPHRIELAEPSYGEIVWAQFKKNRIGFAALWMFLSLVILAIIAPVISLDQPFVAVLSDGGGDRRTVFPWIEGLLFNSNVFGQGIDLFFNLLLVGTPVVVPAYLLFKRRFLTKVEGRVRRRRRRRFVGVLMSLFFVSFVALLFVQPRYALTYWKSSSATMEIEGTEYPVVAYRGRGAAEQLALISAVFPPLHYNYTETTQTNERSAIERWLSSDDTERPLRRSAGVVEPDPHLLGTDSSGHDLFVRMLYGTRISLTVGVIAVSIYVLLGIFIGSIAGFFAGKVDLVIQRLIEVFMCFPSFILILTFASFVPSKSIFWIMVIIGVTRWTTVARLVRGEFLRLKQSDFVQAAVAGGLKTRNIIFRHVLPNAMGPVLVAATFGVANAILIEATLSFLGVSDMSTPSWGRILAVGRSAHDFFTMILPGLAIFFTVSVLNLMGEGLRDALDPKLRQ